MTFDFPRYCNFLKAHSLEGWMTFSWKLIATIEKYGGNLAVCRGINVAQLRLRDHTQGYFNQIILEKFQSQYPGGRYNPNNAVPV